MRSPPGSREAIDASVLISATDPNAPKRGLSAYMFFAQEQRDNVREENPGISFGKKRPSLSIPLVRCPITT